MTEPEIRGPFPRPLLVQGQGAGESRGRGQSQVAALRRVRAFFLSFALCLLAGCAIAPPEAVIRTVRVEVPIPTPVYCDPPVLTTPTLPIAVLHTDSPPADTMRDYVATVDILKGAIAQRDLIIQGCRDPKNDQAGGAQQGTHQAKRSGTAQASLRTAFKLNRYRGLSLGSDSASHWSRAQK